MEKPLAGITYQETNKETSFLEPIVPTAYTPSPEDSDTLKKVMERFTKMKSARTRIDMDWQIWQKIIESKFYPYKDGRTRVNVPLFRAISELFVAEATSRKIVRKLEPIGFSDIEKVEIMDEIWEYDWKKERRDEQMTEAEYKCAGFGTCAYYTGYNQTERVIQDIDWDDDGKEKIIKKIMRKGKIILNTLDIRNVYFDDRTTDFDDDNDQIYLEYLTPEQFEAEKGNTNLKNLEHVSTTSRVDQTYYTFEDYGKENTGLIEKMHYFNKQADKYIVIYNRSIVGRNTCLPFAHKELPIVPRQFGFVADSKYGRGLAEACMQFLDKINRLSEMLFDGLLRSNNSIFALGNGLTFDGNSFSFNNQLITFNGQLNDANFRELKGTPPNQPAFQYLQDLLREIAIYVGIDPTAIVGQASSTAFETAVKAESSLKRVNVVLMNRDYALNKVFSRHLSNLMQFFPIADVQKILEVSGNNITTQQRENRKILLDGKKFIPETMKFVEAPGKYEFEVNPNYIRGQMDIIVETNFDAPTLKALKQEAMTKFLQDYQMYSQITMSDPTLQKIITPDDFIRELSKTYNIDINSVGGLSDSIEKEKQNLMSQVRKMTGTEEDLGALAGIGGGIPEAPQQPEGGAPNILPNVENKNLPGVKIPETPGINNLSPAEKIM